jgi:probable rRNA maturation factor
MSARGPVAEIRVRNLQRIISINTTALETFAGKVLPLCLSLPKTKATDLTRLREISVLIVSDRRIASLHRQFLNESGPTDVITFSHGEIFISAETARRHAREFGNPLTRELRLYVVHGLLHLHGFDDRDKVAARKMEKTQEEILKQAERSLV